MVSYGFVTSIGMVSFDTFATHYYAILFLVLKWLLRKTLRRRQHR